MGEDATRQSVCLDLCVAGGLRRLGQLQRAADEIGQRDCAVEVKV